MGDGQVTDHNEQPAEARGIVEALEKIAASKYGLQGIQEDYGHDTNAYNYHAMQYYRKLVQEYQGIAVAALSATLSPQAGGGEGIAGRLCDWDADGEPPVPLMQEAARYIRSALRANGAV